MSSRPYCFKRKRILATLPPKNKVVSASPLTRIPSSMPTLSKRILIQRHNKTTKNITLSSSSKLVLLSLIFVATTYRCCSNQPQNGDHFFLFVSCGFVTSFTNNNRNRHDTSAIFHRRRLRQQYNHHHQNHDHKQALVQYASSGSGTEGNAIDSGKGDDSKNAGDRMTIKSAVGDDDDDNNSQTKKTGLNQNKNQNQIIDGLLPPYEYDRANRIHQCIQELRRQIPLLLKVPLTDESGSKLYTDDTRLVVSTKTHVKREIKKKATIIQGKTPNANEKISKEDVVVDTTTETDEEDDVEEIELANSRKELISISTSLVLAMTASTRAGQFLSSFGGGGGGNSRDNSNEPPLVRCKLILQKQHPDRILVEWETNLLPEQAMVAVGGENSRNLGDIQGTSELVLSKTDNRIRKHRLLSVTWNGQEQDAKTIGQALASARRGVQTIQENPLFNTIIGGASSTREGSNDVASFLGGASTPFANIFNQVRDEFLEQIAGSRVGLLDDENLLAPLYIRVPVNATATTTTTTIDADSDDGTTILSLDEYEEALATRTNSSTGRKRQQPPPLPGSSRWETYAMVHRIIEDFVYRKVPILSEGVDKTRIRSLFSSQAQLFTLDGTVLVQGSSRLANFYASLSTLRGRTFGTWQLQKASVLEWTETRSVIRVQYKSTTVIPTVAPRTTTGNTITVTGTDVFILSHDPNTSESGSSIDFPRAVIDEIRQDVVSIGGNNITSTSQQDGLLFLRSLATAAESGRINDSSIWLDLLERIGDSSSRTKKKDNTPKKQSSKVIAVPRRSDEAAIVVYRIMDSLLREIPSIVDSSNSYYLPPAQEYMVDSVKLLGYFGEILLRGQAAYDRSYRFTIASLKAALRTGQLVSEKEPSLTVEMTSERNVQVSLTFFLKIKPLQPPGFPSLPFSAGGENNDSNFGGAGLPLRLGIVSEYILDVESGLVTEHKLKETRVNGQLTPADIVSRWIQRQQPTATNRRGSLSDDSQSADSFLRGLVETVDWVRSLSDNK